MKHLCVVLSRGRGRGDEQESEASAPRLFTLTTYLLDTGELDGEATTRCAHRVIV
jgi:hypothetical protein